jgi:hypothetical protein
MEKLKRIEGFINLLYACLIAWLISLLGETTIWQKIGFLILSFPWHFGKNIYSLFGGFNFSGDVRSLFPLVQVAKGNCVGVFSILIFQYAKGNCVGVFSILIFQYAKEDAELYIGISIFQYAEEELGFLFGISIFQYGISADNGIGLQLFQIAQESHSAMVLGIYQYVKDYSMIDFGEYLFRYGKRIYGKKELEEHEALISDELL